MAISLSQPNRFEFSGKSCLLEDYKCFDDRSALEWQDGRELINNPSWSKDQKNLWYYFYRPYNYGNNIAKHQRELIESLGKDIVFQKKMLGNFKLYGLLFFLLSSFVTYQMDIILLFILLPLLVLIVVAFRCWRLESKILEIHKNIGKLQKEVDFLVDRQQEILASMLSPQEVEDMFWDDIRNLEGVFLKRIFNEESDKIRDKATQFYKKIIDSNIHHLMMPIFPVIPSWGLLQPSEVHGMHGNQKTGLNMAAQDVGARIATWRNTIDNQPFFRIWFIQFLFFQEKMLYTVSLYYDFISKKSYGVKREVYQYNHVTNYSYNEEDLSYMQIDPLVKHLSLPDNLTHNIYGNEVKTISFYSASGSSYRCVLPDRDVSDGLKEWLNYKDKNRMPEDMGKLSNAERIELFENEVKYHDLISTLAEVTFKELSSRVEGFAIREDYSKR